LQRAAGIAARACTFCLRSGGACAARVEARRLRQPPVRQAEQKQVSKEVREQSRL
jgi:hypothetical protein